MMDVVEFFRILREKIKTVLALLVAGILVGVLAYFVLTPVFETRTTFMVLESKLIRRTLEGKKLDIDTYLNFVDNEALYHEIYENLQIEKKYDMDFEEFKRSFDVSTVEDTAIIKLLVTFQDPDVSYRIAKMLGDLSLKLNRQVIEKEVHAGYRFSEAQVQAASNQLESARKALDSFLSEHPIQKMAMEIDTLRNRVAMEETGELAVFPPVESVLIASRRLPAINQSGITPKAYDSLARIQAEMEATQAELAAARSDNRKLDAKRRLHTLQLQLKQKQNTLSTLKSRLQELESRYDPLKSQYQALESEFVAAQNGYEKIYQTGLESRIEVIGKTKEMTIIAQPVKPQKPAFPKWSITLPAGFLLGLLAGFAYITLVAFSRRLQDA